MRSPNLTWAKFKKELSMQYSIIPSDTYATQAFTIENKVWMSFLMTIYNCVSELLLKIYHISDLFRFSAEVPNHYAVVYGLNCKKLKDSMAGHWSAQWKMREEYFRDICNISMGSEWAKAYCRAKFSIPDRSVFNKIKAMKKTGQCYKCGRPHLQHECTSNGNNKFPNTTTTQKNAKTQLSNKFGSNITGKICFQWEHCCSRLLNQ